MILGTLFETILLVLLSAGSLLGLWLLFRLRAAMRSTQDLGGLLSDLQATNRRLEQSLDEFARGQQHQAEALVSSQRDVSHLAGLLAEQHQYCERLDQLENYLFAASTRDEAYQLIGNFLPVLCPGWSAVLNMSRYPEGPLRVVAASDGVRQHDVRRDECWAMRTGDPQYRCGQPDGVNGQARCQMPPGCAHLADAHALCLPLHLVNGCTGILRMARTDPLPEETFRDQEVWLRHLAVVLRSALSGLELRLALHRQSTRDALTGLFNRRYLEDSLERELHRVRREGACLCLVLIDIDDFSRYNQLHGYEDGDDMLRLLAIFLQQEVRRSDLAARLSQDEFAVIMSPARAAQATARIAEIQDMLRTSQSVFRSGQRLHEGWLTVSIGIVESDGSHALEELMSLARDAVVRAHQAGGDRLEVVPFPDLMNGVLTDDI